MKIDMSRLPDSTNEEYESNIEEQKSVIDSKPIIDLSGLPDSESSTQEVNNVDVQDNFFKSSLQHVETNPDEYAKNTQLARNTGIPLDYIENNKEVGLLNDTEIPEYILKPSKYPVTSKYFSNPNNFAISKDDSEKLSGTELAIKGYRTGKLSVEQGNLYFEIMFNDDPKLKQQADELDSAFGNIHDSSSDSFLDRTIYETSQILPMVFGSMGAGASRASLYGTSAFGTALGVTALTPIPEEVAVAPIAFGMGAKTGFAIGSMEYVFKLEAGLAYKEMLEATDVEGNKIDPEIAKIAALIIGGVNAGLEFFSLSVILNRIPGGNKFISSFTEAGMTKLLKDKSLLYLLGKFGKNVIVDTAEQTAQELLQESTTILGSEIGKVISGFTDDSTFNWGYIGDRLKETAVSSLFGMGGLSVGTNIIGSSVNTVQFVNDKRKVTKAQKTYEEVIKPLLENLKSSKTTARMPENMSAFLDEVGKENGVESVYIPVKKFEEFYQENLDETIEKLDIQDSYEDAKITEGSVEIPISKIAEIINDKSIYEELAKNMKFDQDELTANEAEEEEKSINERLETAIEEMKQKAESGDTKAEDSLFVFEEIKARLVEIGYSSEEASANAAITASSAEYFGDILGISPLEWFNSLNLDINKINTIDNTDGLFQWGGTTSLTMNRESHTEAMDMAMNGKTPQEIMDKTGWFHHAGAWKYPIDIEDIRIKWDNLTAKHRKTNVSLVRPTLGDILEGKGAENLFKAYPVLRDTEIFPYKAGRGGKIDIWKLKTRNMFGQIKKQAGIEASQSFYGISAPLEQLINLKLGNLSKTMDLDTTLIENTKDLNLDEVLVNTLVHEIQHVIQSFEVWDSLGSDETVNDEYIHVLNRYGILYNIARSFNENDIIRYNPITEQYEVVFEDGEVINFAEIIRDDIPTIIGMQPLPNWAFDEDYELSYESLRSMIVENFAFYVQQIRKNMSYDKINEIYEAISSFTVILDRKGELDETLIRHNFYRKHSGELEAEQASSSVGVSFEKKNKTIPDYTNLLSIDTINSTTKMISKVNFKINKNSKGFEGYLNGLKELTPPFPIDENSGKEILDQAKVFTTFQQDKLGAITIKDGKYIISLAKDSNESTFIHEMSHLWLDQIRTIAKTNTDITTEWKNIKIWAGVNKKDADLTKKDIIQIQESWAEGFERYLQTGRGPTINMHRIFAMFKKWLTKIYEGLKHVRVELTPEIEKIMNKIVSTTNMIEDTSTLRQLHDAMKRVNLTDIELKEYAKLSFDAQEEAYTRLFSNVLFTLTDKYKLMKNRMEKKFKIEAREVAKNMPLYRLRRMVTKKEIGKINTRVFKEMFYVDDINVEVLKDYIFSNEGTINDLASINAILEMVGFESAENLVNDLLTLPNERTFQNNYVHSKLLEIDRQQTKTLKEQAEEYMHSNKTLELVCLQRQILENKFMTQNIDTDSTKEQRIAENKLKTKQRAVHVKAVKYTAQKLLGKKKIKDAINTHRYIKLEHSAGKQVEALIKAGKYDQAITAIDLQAIYYAMAVESIKLKDKMLKSKRYISKFLRKPEKKKQEKRIGHSALDQIYSLLTKFGFNAPETIDKEVPSLETWINDMEGNFELVPIDPLLLEDTNVDFKTISMKQYLSLIDAVRIIEVIGRNSKQIIKDGKKQDLSDAIGNMVEQVVNTFDTPELKIITAMFEAISAVDAVIAETSDKEALKDLSEEKQNIILNYRAKLIEFKNIQPGVLDKVLNLISSTTSILTKVEWYVYMLDGFEDFGPWHDYILNPMEDARNARFEMHRDAFTELNNIFDAYSDKEWHILKNKKVFYPIVNQSFTKEAIMMIALNCGTESNKERITSGYGWDNDKVDALIQTLDEKDWLVIQNVWKWSDKFWDKIVKLQREASGTTPKHVEGIIVNTPYGDIMGGFVPIVYDSNLSTFAFELNDKVLSAEFKDHKFALSITNHGYTETRARTTGMPLNISSGFMSIAQHMGNVIYDLAYRQALINVGKTLKNKELRTVMQSVLGLQGTRQFLTWINAIAKSQRDPYGVVNTVLRKARYGSSIVAMGMKMTVSVAQFLGFFNSAYLIGTKEVVTSLAQFVASPNKTWKVVMSNSVMMQNRMQNFDRDSNEYTKRIEAGHESKLDKINKMSLTYFAGLCDMLVSVPSWHAQFNKSLKEGKSVKESSRIADTIVKRSQGSGAIESLAAIQRGDSLGEFQKLFTQFYSFFSVLYQQFVFESKKINYNRKKDAKTIGNVKAHIKHLPQVFTFLMYLWVLPALLGELVVNRGPEDDESWMEWALKELFKYPLATVPIVRDIASYALDKYEYRISPSAEAFKSIAELSRDVVNVTLGEGDMDQILKHGYKVAGYWTPFPSNQIKITTTGFIDWLQDKKDWEFKDLFFYNNRK